MEKRIAENKSENITRKLSLRYANRKNEKKPNGFLMEDYTEGRGSRPISCVNTVDDAYPPRILYLEKRTQSQHVNINTSQEFLCGCDCTDGCRGRSKCACRRLTRSEQLVLGPARVDPGAGYTERRLAKYVPTGIYECNDRCQCKLQRNCSNRVAQGPCARNLQLFRTEHKGWGVRCMSDVRKGSFICCYVGKIVPDTEAEGTGLQNGDQYLANLDFIECVRQQKDDYERDVAFEDDDHVRDGNNLAASVAYAASAVPTSSVASTTPAASTDYVASTDSSASTASAEGSNKNSQQLQGDGLQGLRSSKKSVREYFDDGQEMFSIDGLLEGNIARFINHSCSPNLFVQNVFVDTHDLRFPWVALFANRFISKGTELTWDYNYAEGSVPGRVIDCLCKSKYCRGRLI